MPAKPPVRRTATRVPAARVPDEAPLEALPGPAPSRRVTPTSDQAPRTASAWAPAAATVAAAKPAKSVARHRCPEVSAAYQIGPAPSQDRPPMPVAAR